jgi:DNA polymerase-2
MTGVPIQEMARKSPGAGITAMFTLTSLRRGRLVPNEKLHVEQPKTLRQLFIADKGGLIYQPTLGLHRNVVQIDYSSMYPSIMSVWNVSPETVGVASEVVRLVPELEIPIDQIKLGIVAETLEPLLRKRLEMKRLLSTMEKETVEYKLLDARNTSLKWLLVVCFGYQGYKNFREGRIEAHEAITAFSRAALVRTMRIAEEMGFQVLHMYVDSLWMKRPDERPISAKEVLAVLDRVQAEVGLPITTEANYNWVAFLPARSNPNVPVPNRYFGELTDGSFKVRGTASRRHDTPPLLTDLENEVLQTLAAGGSGNLARRVQDVVALLRQRVAQLRRREVPLEQLVVRVNVSRAPEDYRVRSSAAVAGLQLQSEGRNVRAGQLVKFVYVKGSPRVHAWDSRHPLDLRCLDVNRYCELIIRMASSLLQPISVTEAALRAWVIDGAWYGPSPAEFEGVRVDNLPLFDIVDPAPMLQRAAV